MNGLYLNRSKNIRMYEILREFVDKIIIHEYVGRWRKHPMIGTSARFSAYGFAIAKPMPSPPPLITAFFLQESSLSAS